MQNQNIIILIGRVGKPPVFTTHGETHVAKFSMATTKRIKNKKTDEYEDKTTWHQIVTFGVNAVYARDYIVEGAECYINGEQDNFVFKKDDGTKLYGSQVIANTVSANKYVKTEKTNNPSPNMTPQDFPDVPDNF